MDRHMLRSRRHSILPTLISAGLFVLAAACADEAPGAPGAPDDDPDPPAGGPGDAVALALTLVVDGLERPVYLTAPAGDDRLFIVEKPGRIRIVEDGTLLPTPFLDLEGAVSGANEQGLLSVAFHPDYAVNGQFYVDYTDVNGDTRVERYQVGADPNLADPSSAILIMSIAQPFANHNGGHLLFGPDGMLYITAGDGGSGGDPLGNGQDRTTRLGTIMRVDVDGGDPYAIPPDNPYAGHAEFLPEIWLWGLRNPWRIAFDRSTGDLYVADVGQGQWEEVTVVGAEAGGANLGWNIVEGTHCFGGASCTPSEFTLPQIEYSHDDGCSVTGGFVYRGSIEDIRGLYFYSDYCAGWLRSFRYAGGEAAERTAWDVADVGNVTSFGEDAAGELYLLTEQAVYRLDRAPEQP